MHRICHALIGLTVALAPALAEAQSWPSRRITIISPFPAGAVTDVLGRLYAAHLEKKYKQPVIVEARTGGGQVIAMDAVIRAPADGYTLLVGSNGTFTESIINKDAPFNSTRDLTAIGAFAGSGLFIVVNASFPAKTLAEFVAYSRANPGKVNFATAGIPAPGTEEFRHRLNLNWTMVPYKGGGPAFQAMLSNEVHAYNSDIMQSMPAQQAGKVRILGYTGSTRHAGAPDVPTLSEGVPELGPLEYLVWIGMYARSEVPIDIMTRLNADILEMQSAPESLQRFAAIGWAPLPWGLQAVRRDLDAYARKIQTLLDAGVKLR
jgi:tripartite-type tricarboxylate transporter receptor subunit TctC